MHVPHPFRPHHLAAGIVFMFLLAVLAASAPPPAVAAILSQGADTQPVYLPMLMQGHQPPPPPSAFDQIDADLEAGRIDAETALIYKTFAEFGDPRLPAAYRSGDIGGEAGLFMLELVEAFPGLSSATQDLLAPFFTPPYETGSWLAQSGRTQAGAAPSDWAYISAAGGKARVWYQPAKAGLQRKATVLAGEITSNIWPKLTGLMQRDPIPDSAGIQNFILHDHYRESWTGTFLPFTGYAGMAVPQTCSPTPSLIYVNADQPDFAPVRSQGMVVGIAEAAAHEFMHALQFSYNLAVDPCLEYRWLGEATASWAEEFVYPDHDTEWRLARYFLDNPWYRLHEQTGYHDYGLYLLVYERTQKYNEPGSVRQAWVNAQYMDSYESFLALGGLNFEQVAALWNKAPFSTFFQDEDTLPYQIKPKKDEILTAAGGFKEYVLEDTLLPGMIHAYHYTVDPSVRTITILDGLTTQLTQGLYHDRDGDLTYNQEQASEDDLRGAQIVTLVKFESTDEVWTAVNAWRQDFCQDWLKQRVSEILIFVTNNDLTDRNNWVQPTGVSTRILVSSVPCVKLQGSASVTTEYDGVTESLSASGLEYVSFSYLPELDLPPMVNIIDPEITMRLTGGSASWNIEGTDSDGCTYSGSDSFTITKDGNPSMLSLYFSLLPGSTHFMGYEGTGTLDSPTPESHYSVSCPDQPVQNFYPTVGNFFMPDGETPVSPDGRLTGEKVITEGEIVTRWEWNFSPVTAP